MVNGGISVNVLRGTISAELKNKAWKYLSCIIFVYVTTSGDSKASITEWAVNETVYWSISGY